MAAVQADDNVHLHPFHLEEGVPRIRRTGRLEEAGAWCQIRHGATRTWEFDRPRWNRRSGATLPECHRKTIRLVMNHWRQQGRLEILGKGRYLRVWCIAICSVTTLWEGGETDACGSYERINSKGIFFLLSSASTSNRSLLPLIF